jgi:cytochrome c556
MRGIYLGMSLLGLAVVGGWIVSRSSAAPKVNDVHAFMQVKLEDSKKVLEGLTTENFDVIVKNSQEMSLLSEDALWQVFQSPDYVQRSADFRRITDRLTEAARKKNLDGAALAYVELTMSCIECHKYVRDQRSGVVNRQRAAGDAK